MRRNVWRGLVEALRLFFGLASRCSAEISSTNVCRKVTYRIRAEDGGKEHEGVCNDDVDGKDEGEELSLEKAEHREGEVPEHDGAKYDD